MGLQTRTLWKAPRRPTGLAMLKTEKKVHEGVEQADDGPAQALSQPESPDSLKPPAVRERNGHAGGAYTATRGISHCPAQPTCLHSR